MARIQYWQVLLCALVHFRTGSFTEIIEINTETKEDIFSTNYPNLYPAGEDKEWRISHDYGRWLITVQDFHLQASTGCANDYLEILEDGNRPRRLCGRKSKQDIISKSSNVRIRFHSDETEQRRGFRLTVKRMLDDDDIKRKSESEAATANVVKRMEDSWMFRILIACLGCALLVFTVLITFLCLEMRKKRLERRSKQFNGVAFQWPPRTRSGSKSYGRQTSNTSTAPLTDNERHGY